MEVFKKTDRNYHLPWQICYMADINGADKKFRRYRITGCAGIDLFWQEINFYTPALEVVVRRRCSETIKITMSGKVKKIPKGTTLLEFLKAYPTTDRSVVAARVGNRLRNSLCFDRGCDGDPVDLSSQDGIDL